MGRCKDKLQQFDQMKGVTTDQNSKLYKLPINVHRFNQNWNLLCHDKNIHSKARLHALH